MRDAPIELMSRLWRSRVLITRSPVLAPLGQAGLRTLSWLLRYNPLQTRTAHVRKCAYLNAGCGKAPAKGFVNLDYLWQPGVDLVWDLKWRLPFADSSLRGIYTEHCLEHLPLSLVIGHLFSEFYRTLAPGGRLRIIVPDAGLYARLYTKACGGDRIEVHWPDEPLATAMMHLNRCFRGHGHLYAYDFDTLRHFLDKAGFRDIELRNFMDGNDPMLLIDTPMRARESVYVEAAK